MRISIYDIIFICLGLSYGTYEIFINQAHRYSYDIAGILSYILSIWLCISYVKRRPMDN